MKRTPEGFRGNNATWTTAGNHGGASWIKAMIPALPPGDKGDQMLDCMQLTWTQMADVIRAIWLEAKRRNPIGINFYAGPFAVTVEALEEIGDAEDDNPTCEAGPGVD